MENKKMILTIVGIFAVIVILGASYAYITIILKGEKENTITGGSFVVELDDFSEEIGNGDGDFQITDAFPITDTVGKAKEPYKFKLENKSDKNASYVIYLDEVAVEEGKTKLPNDKIKVYLTGGEEESATVYTEEPKLVSNLSKPEGESDNNTHILYSSKLEKKTSTTFALRMWIDNNAGGDIMGNQYAAKIRVVADQVPERAVVVINGDETVSAVVFDGETAKLTLTKEAVGTEIQCTNNMSATISGKDITVSEVKNHTVCTIQKATEG